jgi:hypothetical protein
MIFLRFGRYALGVCALVTLSVGCAGSQPMTGAKGTGVQTATRSLERSSLQAYYQAKFTDEVGYPLPFSTLCLRFKPSGAWFSVPATAFSGTYLTSGKDLFASALAPWSPTAYASLQGSINTEQGSGDYVITQPSGKIYSGGTFTMTRAQEGCS